MGITVCKFGGSSLSDANMFARVLGIIDQSVDRKYIIVSAPGKRSVSDDKITDMLYQANRAQPPEDQLIFSRILERYTSIRDQLELAVDIEAEWSKICEKIHQSPDFAASRGEYLCARLFSAYSKIPFIDAADIIRFDSNGNFDCALSEQCIREHLSGLERAVIPGFYGSMPDGEIKTFSRGGSDVSGALIAAALRAQLYENWTDVDGLFTADPNLLPGALRNPCVSYHQMKSLSRAGAKVLHPDCLDPLIGLQIDTVLKNTYSPEAPGTRITESFDENVPCVSGTRGLCLLDQPPFDFTSRNGRSVTLCHQAVKDAQVVSVLSIFGLGEAAREALISKVCPICIIDMKDHIKIIIRDSLFLPTIQYVHAKVLEAMHERALT